MTISSENRKAGPFDGNDVTTDFPFSFKVFQASDLLVVQTDENGDESALALTTDYTVSLNSDQNNTPGGTVTLLTALPSGNSLVIGTAVANLQPMLLTNNGGFHPTVVNDAMDRVVILVQQIIEKVTRSIKFPISDASLNATLPTAQQRANKALVFDASGNVAVSEDDYDDQAANAATSVSAAADAAATAVASAGAAQTAQGLAEDAQAAAEASAQAIDYSIISAAMGPICSAETLAAAAEPLLSATDAMKVNESGLLITVPTVVSNSVNVSGVLTGSAGANIINLPGRNRIINGDMRIDQRNAGASVTVNSDGLYVADRWRMGITQTGKFSVQRINNSSFSTNNYALKFTSLSAFSPAASDQMGFGTILEGLDIEDLRQGSANARPFTVSFKVKASIAGDYTLRATLVGSVNHLYSTIFNVAQADTEQAVSVTFPACTTGTFNIDNTAGIVLWWDFGSGSTYTGAASATWGTAQINKITGSASLLGTIGATLEITDIQLESGSVSTPFERIPMSASLARCQRYFCASYDNGVVPGAAATIGQVLYDQNYLQTVVGLTSGASVPFVCRMRATPTVTVYSTATGASGKVRDQQNSLDIVPTITNISAGGFCWQAVGTVSTSRVTWGFHYKAESEL